VVAYSRIIVAFVNSARASPTVPGRPRGLFGTRICTDIVSRRNASSKPASDDQQTLLDAFENSCMDPLMAGPRSWARSLALGSSIIVTADDLVT
jgi:hypothetical protein